MKGSALMGFGSSENEEPQPNRAQRRKEEQRRKRAQRKGQRAYERGLK